MLPRSLIAQKWPLVGVMIVAVFGGFTLSAWLKYISGNWRVPSPVSPDLELRYDAGVVITPAYNRSLDKNQQPVPTVCHRFVVPNPWPDKLWHLKVKRVGCGCLGNVLETDTVPPGGQAQIQLCVVGAVVPEKRTDWAMIETDHPQIGKILCVLESRTIPEIVVTAEPEVRLKSGEIPSYAFDVHYHSHSASRPDVFLVTTDTKHCRIDMLPVKTESYVANIWRHSSHCRLTLSDEAAQELQQRGVYTVRVQARCGEAESGRALAFVWSKLIRVEPHAIYLLGTKSGIEITAEKALLIADVVSPDDVLQWSIAHAADGRSATVHVEKKPTTHQKLQRTHLQIRFEQPEKTTVTVPVIIAN